MTQSIFYLIIGILIFDYLLERLLDYLNSTRWSNTLPEELQGIYDVEKYKKAQEYEKTKSRFSLLTSSISRVDLYQGFRVNIIQFGAPGHGATMPVV